MIAQLDPGFTTEGFWANVGIAALGSFVGTIGAFLVAWLIYRRTSNEERARFEASLAHDRQLFRDTIAHDQAVRRDQDAQQAKQREVEALRSRVNTLLALLSELQLNLDAIQLMSSDTVHLFRLRREALDQSYAVLADLPIPTAQAIQRASLFIDRYNALVRSEYARPFTVGALGDANEPITDAAAEVGTHLDLLRRQSGSYAVFEWIPAGPSGAQR